MADYLLFSLNRLEKYRYRQSIDSNIVYCSDIESIEILKSDLTVAVFSNLGS